MNDSDGSLKSWLSHSQKKYCEICGHKYTFTKGELRKSTMIDHFASLSRLHPLSDTFDSIRPTDRVLDISHSMLHLPILDGRDGVVDSVAQHQHDHSAVSALGRGYVLRRYGGNWE